MRDFLIEFWVWLGERSPLQNGHVVALVNITILVGLIAGRLG